MSKRRRKTPSTKRPPVAQDGQVLDVLRALLAEGRTDAVVSLVAQLVDRNAELERQLTQAMTRAKKSEKVPREQLALILDELARQSSDDPAEQDAALAKADAALRAVATPDEPASPEPLRTDEPPPQPPLRTPPAPELPRVDNPLAVPTAERACPRCGGARTCIGHDVTETVELVPARVIVRRDRREKLACSTCDGELARAPVGDKVVGSGKYGPALVAQLLVDKYSDGLPLHRQRERFARLGLDVAVSTLADQVTWATDLLRPLWRAANAAVLAAPMMHLDGTSLPVLDRDLPRRTRLGSLWGYVGVDGDEHVAACLYASTAKKRGQEPGELGPEDMLSLRTGYVVADASNLFDASFRRDDLIECGCHMHARRYFVKALDAGDTRAALALAAYQKLYAIEDEVRDRSPPDRLAVRQARSRPVFDELVTWARVREPHEPPKSPLGAAIRYLLNQKDALGRFLDDGIVPIDNGVVERLHVRAALTRKNYLFAGSDAGGHRAAVAYTILGNCRLAGVDPVAYLTDVLPALSRSIRLRDLPALLPSRWARSRPS